LALKRGFLRERLLVSPNFQELLPHPVVLRRFQLDPLKDARHDFRPLDSTIRGAKVQQHVLIVDPDDEEIRIGNGGHVEVIVRGQNRKLLFTSMNQKEYIKC
jgi:hypothetical protein